jgi:hypothetical protein
MVAMACWKVWSSTLKKKSPAFASGYGAAEDGVCRLSQAFPFPSPFHFSSPLGRMAVLLRLEIHNRNRNRNLDWVFFVLDIMLDFCIFARRGQNVPCYLTRFKEFKEFVMSHCKLLRGTGRAGRIVLWVLPTAALALLLALIFSLR